MTIRSLDKESQGKIDNGVFNSFFVLFIVPRSKAQLIHFNGYIMRMNFLETNLKGFRKLVGDTNRLSGEPPGIRKKGSRWHAQFTI